MLVGLIREGEEGPRVLVTPPRPGSTTGGSAISAAHSQSRTSEKDEFEATIEGQQALLESLAPAETVPDWVERDLYGGGPGGREPQRLSMPVPDFGPAFKKAAKPPPRNVQVKTEPAAPSPEQPEGPEAEEVPFRKPAMPPPSYATPAPKASPVEGRFDRLRVGSMAEREKAARAMYGGVTLDLYRQLKVIGVRMEVSDLIEKDGNLDLERFSKLTAPSRAATGMGYARMVARLLRWREKVGFSGEGTPGVDSTLGVLGFVEFLIQGGVGFLTPKTLFYALDYYGKAFGFDPNGPQWRRAKRLADLYAKAKEGPVSRAPALGRGTLEALENMVLDVFLERPVRVAAGKLRLCVQASIRYDDLLNTPLRCCEWVRRPGEEGVVGLRSRAVRGKSGPRLWVASLRGVSESNDRWLPTLMDLVLQAHGASWRRDDHFGKAADQSGAGFLVAPASLGGDATLVKQGLEAVRKMGKDPGLSPTEVAALRWHGAKSTFTSIMQHLGVKPVAVRFSGNWASKEDTPARRVGARPGA